MFVFFFFLCLRKNLHCRCYPWFEWPWIAVLSCCYARPLVPRVPGESQWLSWPWAYGVHPFGTRIFQRFVALRLMNPHVNAVLNIDSCEQWKWRWCAANKNRFSSCRKWRFGSKTQYTIYLVIRFKLQLSLSRIVLLPNVGVILPASAFKRRPFKSHVGSPIINGFNQIWLTQVMGQDVPPKVRRVSAAKVRNFRCWMQWVAKPDESYLSIDCVFVNVQYVFNVFLFT